MLYTDYQASRDLAWEILIREKITELPVSMVDLCRQLGVDVRRSSVRSAGYSMLIDDCPTIVVNGDDPTARQRFTAAHELGHILLKHTDKYGVMYRDPSPKDDPKEQAANVFAARLLAPAIVLRDLKVTNAEQIEKLCDISKPAAEYRMRRLQLLYDREQRFLAERGYSCFGLSPLEREVEKQFCKYIKSHAL
ncbi:MAG: ImmA/IrrE family metallo-endopeptidase [Clostridiales bacterium]|nr:ImmA/IrrE family metallo-endopeptidase [Clostridiales bacterium]